MENTINTNAQSPKGRTSVKVLTKIAILAAISTIIMLFEFPLPFIAPSFYELDLSEVVVLVGGFAMGPMAAVTIEAIKIILNFVLNGTITAGVGEVANFVIGCSLVVPAAVIYRRHKSRKSAVVGLAVGTVSLTVVGVLLNYFVLLPAYSYFMGVDLSVFVGMGTAINAWVTDLGTLVVFATAPFNIIKGVTVSLLTLLLYKRLSPLLKK